MPREFDADFSCPVSSHTHPACTRFLYSTVGFNHSDELTMNTTLSKVCHVASSAPWEAEFHSPLTATAQELWFTGKQWHKGYLPAQQGHVPTLQRAKVTTHTLVLYVFIDMIGSLTFKKIV